MNRLTGIVALLLLLPAAATHADDVVRSITVDGQATITATPDLAHLSMAVQARDLDLGAARERVIGVTRDFLAFCDQQGIGAAKVRTTGLTIQPQYRWNDEKDQQELQAYLVRRQLDVEITDLEKLGPVIEGAADLGVNEVSPPRLASSREDELRREALAAAARDAEANARVLAEALNVSLGDALQVVAQREPGLAPVPMMERVQMAAAEGVAQTYSAGEIRFEASVSARFALSDAN
jgi:uncharacterized protein YggE